MKAKSTLRQARGRAARLDGRRGEWLAALLLMLKGYRILGFRLRTPQGEIDLLAQRGRVLAVVEVKLRLSEEDARSAVKPEQRDRLRKAGLALASRRRGLKGLVVRLDLIALSRDRRWPRHIANAWLDGEAR